MKLQTQQRRAADINDILESMGLSARLNVSMDNCRSYTYMRSIETSIDNFSVEVNMPLRKIIAIAKEMEEAAWIKIETVCMNLIGKKVWVDKEIEVTIKSISGDTGKVEVLTTSGRTYSADNLWIKE